MKFLRNTHDENGEPISRLPRNVTVGMWPTCDPNMLSSTIPMSVEEIYDAHICYDNQYDPDGFGWTLPDIMAGLADLLRMGLVRTAPDHHPVLRLAKDHKNTNRNKSSEYWFSMLLEKVQELNASLLGYHADPPEWELMQIASICLNWLDRRNGFGMCERLYLERKDHEVD